MKTYKVVLEGKTHEIIEHDDGTFEMPEALRRFKGWGTALKPAVECWWLVRKPIEHQNVASQVLDTGTGALNIDGCRVKSDGSHCVPTVQGRTGGMVVGGDDRQGAALGMFEPGKGFEPTNHQGGRYPSHLVLSHSHGCQKVGTKTVEAPVINRFDDGMKPFGDGAGHPYTSTGGGTEEQPVYECVGPSTHTVQVFTSDDLTAAPMWDDLEELLEGAVRLRSRLLLAGNHTEGTESTQSNVPGNALPVSSQRDLTGGCPACSRFCGEQLPPLRGASQASARQLAYALGPALDQVHSLRCTQTCRLDGHPSSSGGVPGGSAGGDTSSNRSSEAFASEVGTGARTLGMGSEGHSQERRLSDTSPNSTHADARWGSSSASRSACNGTGLRLFVREVWVLASKHLPVSVAERSITTHGCPVKKLNEQSGASRFFQNFEPSYDVPFFYTGKASKRDKNADLDDMPDQPSYMVENGGKTSGLDGKRYDRNTVVKNTHPCLHPEALVMTVAGYRPIKDIHVGDQVLTADGSFHSVEQVSQHPYTSETLVDIRVLGTNFTTLASDNHPFLVWRPARKGNYITGGEVHWLRADQIVKGDYTMTPIVQAGGVAEPPRADDTDFWFIVGLYLAEGCPHAGPTPERHYPSFSLHEDEQDFVERLRMYAAPTTIGVYAKKGHQGEATKGIQVVVFDSDLGQLCIDLCGRGAATKTIAPCVWNLPEESLHAFVEGYFAGDGGHVRTYLQAKSASRDLASQMRFFGEMLGYKVEFQWYPAKPGHIGDRDFKTTSPEHVLRMSARNRTLSHRKPSKPTVVAYEGAMFTLAYVKSVDRVSYEGDVINLSVEGSPTFQTAVGMSHNTVKSQDLMQYLVRLVTPPGGIVLDPFAGSGSTLVAAVTEGMQFIGIEREDEYVKIAQKRVDAVIQRSDSKKFGEDLFELAMSLGDEE